MSKINKRKIDHVNLIKDHREIDRDKAYFDFIHLEHRALPDVSLDEIDTSISFMNKSLSFPLIISSMTGGSDDELITMNKNLALAAEAENVALAVGSQRILLKEETAEESFSLRKFAPSILLFANIGAVQLNYGITSKDCKRMIDILDANGIYLHLNPLQEAIQPEGDTNFKNLDNKIKTLINEIDCPILVKEVGSGFSPSDAERLKKIGIKYIDISGSGGTSWSLVESKRSEDARLGELYKDWGIPTPLALKMLKPFKDDFEFIASGGIRNGLDMAKSIILGASLCGLAKPFLEPAQISADAVRAEIQKLKKEFSVALFLLGINNVRDLIGREDLICYEDRY